MTRRDRAYRHVTRAGLAVGVACGVCCALPVITLLGGMGVVSMIGAAFERFEPALLVLAVLALGGAAVLWVRRRRRSACRVPTGVVDLGMPEPTRPGPQ